MFPKIYVSPPWTKHSESFACTGKCLPLLFFVFVRFWTGQGDKHRVNTSKKSGSAWGQMKTTVLQPQNVLIVCKELSGFQEEDKGIINKSFIPKYWLK